MYLVPPPFIDRAQSRQDRRCRKVSEGTKGGRSACTALSRWLRKTTADRGARTIGINLFPAKLPHRFGKVPRCADIDIGIVGKITLCNNSPAFNAACSTTPHGEISAQIMGGIGQLRQIAVRLLCAQKVVEKLGEGGRPNRAAPAVGQRRRCRFHHDVPHEAVWPRTPPCPTHGGHIPDAGPRPRPRRFAPAPRSTAVGIVGPNRISGKPNATRFCSING
jgi:hypothetical protein